MTTYYTAASELNQLVGELVHYAASQSLALANCDQLTDLSLHIEKMSLVEYKAIHTVSIKYNNSTCIGNQHPMGIIRATCD